LKPSKRDRRDVNMGANDKGLRLGSGAEAPAGVAGPQTVPLPAPLVRSGPFLVPGAARKSAATGAAPAAAGLPGVDRKLVLAALVGLLVGALIGYLVSAMQFNDQVNAINQASEMRVTAANQRIRELQDQQRAFAEQVDKQQQELVAQADEQQRRIVTQVSDQERAIVAQQRAELARAQQRERDLAKPDLPVKVWVRRAPALGGLVGQVHNFGSVDLAVAVTVHSAATGQQNVWQATIPPNATQAIGKDPGWVLAVGDSLHLQSDGFRPLDVPIQPAAHAKPAAAH
jgi:hypothetical protein